MNQYDKKKLLNYIDAVSFALIDTNLYLDTHPNDKKAMDHFNQYQKARKQALKEQIFENRFKTVPWLKKMGADITLSGDSVLVKGVETLKGSEVYGEDLRGTAALITAGLAAQETTVIHDADYILRGYMDLCENLKGLGAEIEWENS